MKVKINLGGIAIIITALLCILKFVGILKISWLWCFSLFLIPIALFIAVVCFTLVIAFVVSIVDAILNFGL